MAPNFTVDKNAEHKASLNYIKIARVKGIKEQSTVGNSPEINMTLFNVLLLYDHRKIHV